MTQRLRLHYVNTTSCWSSEDIIIASRARWEPFNNECVHHQTQKRYYKDTQSFKITFACCIQQHEQL